MYTYLMSGKSRNLIHMLRRRWWGRWYRWDKFLQQQQQRRKSRRSQQ
jgi:hypothetical protein